LASSAEWLELGFEGLPLPASMPPSTPPASSSSFNSSFVSPLRRSEAVLSSGNGLSLDLMALLLRRNAVATMPFRLCQARLFGLLVRGLVGLVGVDLHVDIGVADLVFDLIAGLLDVVGDVAADVLCGIADVLGGIFGDVAVIGDAGRAVVGVFADLARAEQQ